LLNGNVCVANDRAAVNDLLALVGDPAGHTTSASPQRNLQARLENLMIDANGNLKFHPIEAVPVRLREATGQHKRKPSS